MSWSTWSRWAVLHGSARALMWRARRKGDLAALLTSDPLVQDDPFPVYQQVRARGRLVPGTFVTLAGHHDTCTTILRSDRFGVGFDRENAPWFMRMALGFASDSENINPVEPPSMLAVDPPDHTRYRKLVSKVFTARAIENLRGRVEEVADQLLDDLERRGESADLVPTYAGVLPVTVIAEVLGVPTDMRDQFLEWGNEAAATLDIGLPYQTFTRADAGVKALNEWMHGHFERLRRNPGEDILSKLVTLVDEGDRLDERELMATALLLLGAGFETTVNLIGNGTLALLRNPDQLAILRDDPASWANAVDEVLRYDSPVQSTGRMVREDMEMHGVPLRQGRIVVTLLGSANRDPECFSDPDRFDVTRENAKDHLAFSSGIHYCLGANLARLEGEIALRKLFERFPDLALAGPPHRRPTRTLRGYDAMPVALNRRERKTVPV